MLSVGMDNSVMSPSTRNSCFYDSSSAMGSSAFLGSDPGMGVNVKRKSKPNPSLS